MRGWLGYATKTVVLIRGTLKGRMRGTPAPQRSKKTITAGIFFAIFLASVTAGFAQGYGDVARQDRERRQENSRRPYVYTNEDLANPRSAVREARREAQEITAEESAVAAENQQPVEPLAPSSIVWPEAVPLGDIARFYRMLRERELELARRLDSTVPEPPALDMDFLLPSPLASPVPEIAHELLPPPALQTATPEPVWESFAEPEAVVNNENTVRVEPGDTLWKIAERHLGEGNAWRQIAEANPELRNPNHIQPGQILRLPGAAAGAMISSSASSSSSSAEHTVRVQSGDSLWKLAASQLGTGNAWTCLAAANPQIENANRIYPGQNVVIPANCSTGS